MRRSRENGAGQATAEMKRDGDTLDGGGGGGELVPCWPHGSPERHARSCALSLSLSVGGPCLPAPLAHSAVDTPSEPVHRQWLSCLPSWSKRPEQESRTL